MGCEDAGENLEKSSHASSGGYRNCQIQPQMGERYKTQPWLTMPLLVVSGKILVAAFGAFCSHQPVLHDIFYTTGREELPSDSTCDNTECSCEASVLQRT